MTVEDITTFLSDHASSWHHWLLIMFMLKKNGRASKKQLMSVLMREGFSPNSLESIFVGDIVRLDTVVSYDGHVETLGDTDMIYLTDDTVFRKFVKKHMKDVVRFLKMNKNDS